MDSVGRNSASPHTRQLNTEPADLGTQGLPHFISLSPSDLSRLSPLFTVLAVTLPGWQGNPILFKRWLK